MTSTGIPTWTRREIAPCPVRLRSAQPITQKPAVLQYAKALQVLVVGVNRGVKVCRKRSAKTVSGAAHAQKPPAVCACALIWLQVGVSVVYMPPLRCYCTTTCVGCMAAQGCQTVHNCQLQRCLALQKQPLAPGSFHWRCF